MKNGIVITISTFLLILLLSYQPPKTSFSQESVKVLPDIQEEKDSVSPLIDTLLAYKIKLDSMKEYTKNGGNFIATQQQIVEIQTKTLTSKTQ